MGFPEFSTPAGLQSLEAHLQHVSYIEGYQPSQADVAVFKALPSSPDATTYPHSARWYKHIQSYETEHVTLPGDASKPHTAYGPSSSASALAPEPVEVTEAKAKAADAEDDDDEIDLFGSDDEEVDAEAEALKQKRLAEYAAKKAHKPKTIAKSVVTMDVKPWDDETDMAALEKSVRSIEKDGLVWGLSKLVPIGYGIRKLQITLVIEDDKIGLDDLQEEIAEFEDYVQSSDIVAMQKL
ncbi:elongation factor EF-1 beta subunit [Microbotryum lychnidis-dioicae p1A1 Lamole]|uniref:Elongation factor 1-beta n=1 Tax=Microbotryum lychnidis-dioicae (strain p1A1 Lamole / MvSl-1064) TaxID=683840 RepID=U5HCP3_USTV1|nr:elongation factor EF-1 beta subunit [Microbotryum lychnidis-dioicae p1A1 Lamole]|eukprot:KDE04621.1 elongation factor EF-1 beta subunit [Microbotryum lychnidis-dioicae p1A1 Lamole]